MEHARTIFCVKLSINNHIVRLLHKNHIIRTCLMYHAACKVEFQPFTRSYSQLTFFSTFYKKNTTTNYNQRSWLLTTSTHSDEFWLLPEVLPAPYEKHGSREHSEERTCCLEPCRGSHSVTTRGDAVKEKSNKLNQEARYR